MFTSHLIHGGIRASSNVPLRFPVDPARSAGSSELSYLSGLMSFVLASGGPYCGENSDTSVPSGFQFINRFLE